MKNIFSKYQKDNIDQELVVAIRGEVLADGKWTMHAEADDVRKLIEKGAANTHKDRAGGTPLHECCHIGLVEHAKVHKISKLALKCKMKVLGTQTKTISYDMYIQSFKT